MADPLGAFVVILGAAIAFGAGVTLPARAQVVIENDVDAGRPVFKITTPTAVYFYSKAGASLTSLVDADGIDWIDFRAEGSADAIDGSFGWFRGLPNMSRHDFGHSNGRGAVSIALDPLGLPLARATIVSRRGPWATRWEFFPTFARLTVTASGDDYWLLYEGVPGGTLDPADLCWRAGDEPAPCSRGWRGDIAADPDVVAGLEWMVFGDPALDRSLVLLHNDDDVPDQHRLKGGMTVFGFGRSDPGRLQRIVERLRLGSGRSVGRIAGTQDTMLITFVDAVEADVVETHIRSQAQHPSFAPADETVTVCGDRDSPPGKQTSPEPACPASRTLGADGRRRTGVALLARRSSQSIASR